MIVTDHQRGQLCVARAVDGLQGRGGCCRQLVQRLELVVVAVEFLELTEEIHPEFSEFVVATVEIGEVGVVVHIERMQVIVRA